MLRRARMILTVLTALFLLACVAGLYGLDGLGIAPRALGPYLQKRSSGHNPLIEHSGKAVARLLLAADRGSPVVAPPPATLLGAQPAHFGAGAEGTLVSSSDELRAAMTAAQPGQTIAILPGNYRFDRALIAANAGSAAAPITVRAASGAVVLEFGQVEGIKVGAPYWRFEGLTIRGVCATHDDCEHAFHVIGKGHHFIARNNTISDFNAHFKINGEGGFFPDAGLIEHNTLSNSTPRSTIKPVALIDLVAASGWTIRANVISDFSKADGNRVAFGAFVKGGGGSNRFERNLVVCEALLHPAGGQRVGLSLGGGSTEPTYCRDKKCITEQSGSVIEANLIASCSDDGIYLNSAANSRVLHNTLLDTGGIDVRFATSSAQVDGNLVDGAIRARDGGLLRPGDNLDSATAALYLGRHAQRALFRTPERMDLQWAGDVPRRAVDAPGTSDLCGAPRPARPAYGATEDFAACARR